MSFETTSTQADLQKGPTDVGHGPGSFQDSVTKTAFFGLDVSPVSAPTPLENSFVNGRATWTKAHVSISGGQPVGGLNHDSPADNQAGIDRPTAKKPEADSPGIVTTYLKLPVMRLGESPDQTSRELVRSDDSLARMYNEHKNAIVQIFNKTGTRLCAGTGFFISEDGRIATDNHVIDKAQDLTVTTADGRSFKAKSIKTRSTSDLALLDLQKDDPSEKFQALKLAETAEDLQSGARVYALGHPQGWSKIFISPGIINSEGITTGRDDGDSAFNPNRSTITAFVHVEHGNSGSPLLNGKGAVVGIARSIEHSDDDKDSGWLSSLNQDSRLNSRYTTVDDLKGLLPESGRERSLSEYVVPRKVNIDGATTAWGVAAALAAHGTQKDWYGIGNRSVGRGILLPALAAWDLDRVELPYLRGALKDGSIAEKIHAGMDVGADLMVMSRFAGFLSPRLRAVTGALQLGGIAIKLADNVLARRRYD